MFTKGALIGMCLDIIIREKSKEEFLIWCKNSPMNMAFQNRLTTVPAKITALTYPEVGAF
jgi:hypothetical protein